MKGRLCWWPLLAAALLSGCGSFRQAPLPESAPAAPSAGAPPIDAAWAAKLRGADVIYFCLTKRSGAALEELWPLVEVLQGSGQPLTLGWAEIPANAQPRFEQLARREISAAQLLQEVVRPERAALLRQTLRPDLGQAALGCPRNLLARIRDGETLSDAEAQQLPRGFHPRPEAFENFVERATASARLRRYNLRRLYRAHLVAEETIAENIVRFRREHAGTKLLVFLPNDALIDPREVAAYAAQKLPLRQLILDRSEPLRPPGPQLLARRGSRFEVVDRAPFAARDQRGLAHPGLRA